MDFKINLSSLLFVWCLLMQVFSNLALYPTYSPASSHDFSQPAQRWPYSPIASPTVADSSSTTPQLTSGIQSAGRSSSLTPVLSCGPLNYILSSPCLAPLSAPLLPFGSNIEQSSFGIPLGTQPAFASPHLVQTLPCLPQSWSIGLQQPLHQTPFSDIATLLGSTSFQPDSSIDASTLSTITSQDLRCIFQYLTQSIKHLYGDSYMSLYNQYLENILPPTPSNICIEFELLKQITDLLAAVQDISKGKPFSCTTESSVHPRSKEKGNKKQFDHVFNNKAEAKKDFNYNKKENNRQEYSTNHGKETTNHKSEKTFNNKHDDQVNESEMLAGIAALQELEIERQRDENIRNTAKQTGETLSSEDNISTPEKEYSEEKPHVKENKPNHRYLKNDRAPTHHRHVPKR